MMSQKGVYVYKSHNQTHETFSTFTFNNIFFSHCALLNPEGFDRSYGNYCKNMSVRLQSAPNSLPAALQNGFITILCTGKKGTAHLTKQR